MTLNLRTAGAAAAAFLALTASAPAQTADEIIEKHLAASGGKAALSKLTSRTTRGTIVITSPVGDLSGTVEVQQEVPNKSRTLLKLDLAALGAGQVVSDQRFDGNTAYVIDSFNGNRQITGTQLDAMRNGSFPTPLLNYKESGIATELTGREPVDGQDTFVIRLTPKTGPPTRVFIDASTFMLVKTATVLTVPQLGEIEQVLEFSDFRDVDGVKVPYRTRSSNAAQSGTATIAEVTHNVDIDDALFAAPK
jgi:hypothetical protein